MDQIRPVERVFGNAWSGQEWAQAMGMWAIQAMMEITMQQMQRVTEVEARITGLATGDGLQEKDKQMLNEIGTGLTSLRAMVHECTTGLQ